MHHAQSECWFVERIHLVIKSSDPVFPRAIHPWLVAQRTGHLHFTRRQPAPLSNKHCPALILCIATRVDCSEHEFAETRADNGSPVQPHDYKYISSQGTS